MTNAIRDVLGIEKEPSPEEKEIINILAGEIPGELGTGKTGYTDGINIWDRNEEDGR